jgi:hypothetical protein
MKRDFLANFKVGENALPKEIIDAILAENGRDVQAAKADANGLREQLKAAQEGLKAFEGVDVSALNGKVTELTAKLEAQAKEHETAIAKLTFEHALDGAITSAKGRNAKAIRALLDTEKLFQSKDQSADIKKALDDLKTSDGYLFADTTQQKQTPPPFSAGTGTGAHTGGSDAESIAAFRAAAGLKVDKQ